MCELHIRNLGLQEYSSVLTRMREFTTQRSSTSADEVWCVQHPAVITLGANADRPTYSQSYRYINRTIRSWWTSDLPWSWASYYLFVS